jgi:plastocyanin
VRRPLRIPLIVLLVAGLVSACGSDDDSAAPTAGSDTSDATMPMGDEHMDDDDSTMPMPMPMPMDDDGHSGAGHGEPSEVADGAREIDVIADAFAFDPDEITVQAGEDIAIVLTSVDILHDFVIDELGAHVAAERGETVIGGFHADEPGRYTIYCDVTGHREAGMEGTLIVEA